MAGRYRLVRPLGRGVSSVVYLAVCDRGDGHAVKLFHPGLAARAAHEADILQRLHGAGGHPPLPRLRALAELSLESGPRTALVMSLLRGQVVFRRYAQRPAVHFERQAFLHTVADIAAALSWLHGKGLVHRDVKAENALVQRGGAATLIDFDLSGPAHEEFGHPVRIGTEAYLSPEARRGEPLGPESDLYSLGVLLHWGLHGELPEPGRGGLPPRADGELERFVGTLLAPERAGRPHDAVRVERRLRTLAAGASGHAL